MMFHGPAFDSWVKSSEPEALICDVRQASWGHIGALCGQGQQRAREVADALASLVEFARDKQSSGAASRLQAAIENP
jgi:hypothetical protein